MEVVISTCRGDVHKMRCCKKMQSSGGKEEEFEDDDGGTDQSMHK